MGILISHIRNLETLLPEESFTREEHALKRQEFLQKNTFHFQKLKETSYAKDPSLQEYKDRLNHANKCYRFGLYGSAKIVLDKASDIALEIEAKR